MKSIINLGLIAVFLISMGSCKNETEKPDSDKENGEAKNEKIYPVRIQKIEKQSIPKTLDYTADLIAYKEINYAPASPGRINKIYVEVGSKVHKGKLLVEMDKTQLNQALTQYNNAKINFKRMDTLNQLGSISVQQYDQVKTQYDLAKSNYQFLRKNTTLISPINGIVTGKYFESGEMFSGAPNTSAGKAAVLTLMQINPLKAVVSISQSFFPYIKTGMEAKVNIDIITDKEFKGTVNKIYPTIDPGTRTFKCEIIINNAGEKLRPGMYANIIIELGKTDALVVPSIAVLKQEGTNKRFVFINNKGIAKQIEVFMGNRFDDQVELISDEIKNGQELIIEGQANLLNGSKIKIVSENNK